MLFYHKDMESLILRFCDSLRLTFVSQVDDNLKALSSITMNHVAIIIKSRVSRGSEINVEVLDYDKQCVKFNS